MVIVFRVNNEFVGLCHLYEADPLNAHIRKELEDAPSLALLPKEIGVCDFLAKNGFSKGDPVELTFDDRQEVIAIRKPGNVDFLWSRPA